MKYFDISPIISEDTAVFPGDKEFSREYCNSFSDNNILTLSSITTTLHIGAHVDAPIHFRPGTDGIESISLDYYYGPCQVMTVPQKNKPFRLLIEDLTTTITQERILFKTNSYTNSQHWHNEFTALSPELIEFLAHSNIKLIGIDTPSVDPADSSKLESHNACFDHNIAILEGIVLNSVPDGDYQLIALPLKIRGADGSPVRAVLLPREKT